MLHRDEVIRFRTSRMAFLPRDTRMQTHWPVFGHVGWSNAHRSTCARAISSFYAANGKARPESGPGCRPWGSSVADCDFQRFHIWLVQLCGTLTFTTSGLILFYSILSSIPLSFFGYDTGPKAGGCELQEEPLSTTDHPFVPLLSRGHAS